MPTIELDTLGLRCPKPILKLAAKSPEMKEGDILEIFGDCPTFEKDIRAWCERLKKPMIDCVDEGNNRKRCKIQF